MKWCVVFSVLVSFNLFADDYMVKTDDGRWWKFGCFNRSVVSLSGSYWPYMEDLEEQPLYPFVKSEYHGFEGRCAPDRIRLSLWYSDEEVTTFSVDLKVKRMHITHKDQGMKLLQQYFNVTVESDTATSFDS